MVGGGGEEINSIYGNDIGQLLETVSPTSSLQTTRKQQASELRKTSDSTITPLDYYFHISTRTHDANIVSINTTLPTEQAHKLSVSFPTFHLNRFVTKTN